MEKHTFIDRYFHSQYELLDFNHLEDRDINSLFSYLNNMHSTADKLKELFNCDIKIYPEFKILRLIRNYFHHVGDVDEIRLLAEVEENVILSHIQHLIIPLETFAKGLKSFVDNNVVPEGHKNYNRRMKYIGNELAEISKIFSYTTDILNTMEACCNKPSLKLDGTVYELGFDMYKFIYNITNLIADHSRQINELACKKVIINLDPSYTVENNIGRIDLWHSPGKMPITTTQGMIYAKEIELVI